ncbi:MAG: 50S ribosomal protein L23 [Candidatus Diapherotrites archaeon]|uniref:Large ribosomal subunit protein uL23 n=1 Tax=Candidatus Iainarchaeum sp. TaxID=3101447 RepID=A0A2D6M0P7_9ARCH|nr:50S ribosomal protein L23 [Candidatus Diapherotrites archaeon]|tara:strand:- start:2095 stop:2370 length:276 start_codon:yes stop_codon:yes gene_type:complete
MKKTELAQYEIVTYPLITEKAINMIETENKLCFIVNMKANKAMVKDAVEKNYKIKVDSVKILNDRKGRKKAIVKINEKFKADEIATKLGVL